MAIRDGQRERAPRTEREKRVGELLLDARLISPEQLDEALQIQAQNGARTGEILVALGYIDVKSFADCLATRPEMAGAGMSNYEITPDLLKCVPREVAIEYDVFPIDKLGSALTVVSERPLDGKTVRAIEDKTHLRVKALFCSSKDVQAVIDRYYGDPESLRLTNPDAADAARYIEGTLKMENLASLVRGIGSLPDLPEPVRRVQTAMQDPDVSADEVAQIVRQDEALANDVVSVANSPAYGLPHPVSNVGQATARLGLDEVYALVLASGAVQCFRQSDRYDYPRMWRRAMDCARNAMAIAQACGPSQKPCLFGAALLHDVGRMALMEAVPERYARIPLNAWGNELLAIEEEALGFTHLEAGYVLASNWALPVQMVEPIRFHHTVHFAKRVKDVTAVVCVASALTELTQDGAELRDRRLIEECGEVLSLLGLGGDTLAAIARQNASR